MAHFTIEDLERLVGQGGDNVTSYNQSDYMTSPVFRVDVRRDIYDVVCQSDRAVTRGEIARALKRKPSPWLNGRIDQLVADGYLKRSEYTWHNGMPVYYYEVRR
jgi:hypothetical protein